MKKTPLEDWIKQKIGLSPEDVLTRQTLTAYQLRRVQETVSYARSRSPFYGRLFKNLPPLPLSGLSDMAAVPFTVADDIRKDPLQFLCVSQGEVARVVTLQTSGTTAFPKRLFFTEEDLELTVDFFHHGMSTLVSPGDRVLVLMPGTLPHSVGDLLVRGLSRMNADGIVHGPVSDPETVAQRIIDLEIDCLVGIPVQVLDVARSRAAEKMGRLKSVLLSADYVPYPVVQLLSQKWQCPIFQHYGMTETGYGGAVACGALSGYHMREADLFFEIIDPIRQLPVEKGETGEVVVTTLTRKAMPLIRYRTGDIGRFIPDPCPCGTVLDRLDAIQGRLEDRVALGDEGFLSVPLLDTAVFTVPGVLNYHALLERIGGKTRLTLSVFCACPKREGVSAEIRLALMQLPDIRRAVARGGLNVDIVFTPDRPSVSSGLQKRKISVR